MSLELLLKEKALVVMKYVLELDLASNTQSSKLHGLPSHNMRENAERNKSDLYKSDCPQFHLGQN